MESRGVLPTTQFAYRKGFDTCDALLCVIHTLQSSLERGKEVRSVQIDFIAAVDRVMTIRGSSSNSALGEFEVLCCLFCHSFSLICHSMSWCMVVGRNWFNVVSGAP